MWLKIPYTGGDFSLEIPDENLMGVVEPNDPGSAETEKTILEKALKSPVGEGFGSLEEFLKPDGQGASRLLIVINDATRPTPTAAMLKALAPYVDTSLWNTTILIATGAHRAPTEEEYHQILKDLYDRFRPLCVYHDAKNKDEMVRLGVTRNNTPLILNRRVLEAGRIIVTGSVEPHYFAGFTGGPKSFLPGLAAYETIQANHKLALSPGARALALEGNPVHEDMDETIDFLKVPLFSFMAVQDKNQKAAAAFAGELFASFRGAVETAEKIFCIPLECRADIVISIAKYPMDIDLYQSQKAIDNGALALKDGGTLILVSSCRDGLGDETYVRLLASASSPSEALEKIRLEYKLGYHKAARMAMVSERALVKAVTNLPAKELKKVFIESAPSPQAALDEAVERARNRGIETPKVLVLSDGCVSVPALI
jgi:nickel-dependent lactate racemase